MFSKTVQVYIVHQKDPLSFGNADLKVQENGSLIVAALAPDALYKVLAVFSPEQWRHAVRMLDTSK